ncbi:hypothetical protein B0H19DRAFT_1102851 [Mycena capillaripes]|nr:hypothetical protein B0H19DRAFT_1102851 [Mycena capillaripes]
MAEFSSLCPGYKQVDAFGPDDEYEEEEVIYVTLDVGNAEPTLIPSSSHYRLIGLDTPTPFLQLSGTIFKGRHDTLLGTELLFTDGKDPSDWSKRSINHVANTEQRINFKEVQLKQKTPAAAPRTQTKEDGRYKVDHVTGKSEPVQRRTRAPRKRREQPQDPKEAQGAEGADGTVEGNPKPNPQGEEEEDEEEETVQEGAPSAP